MFTLTGRYLTARKHNHLQRLGIFLLRDNLVGHILGKRGVQIRETTDNCRKPLITSPYPLQALCLLHQYIVIIFEKTSLCHFLTAAKSFSPACKKLNDPTLKKYRLPSFYLLPNIFCNAMSILPNDAESRSKACFDIL